jgi:hypothetical protein
MTDKTEGQRAFEGGVVLALRLLNEGYTPEQVEVALEEQWQAQRRATALSDPSNVQMQEVSDAEGCS